MPAKTEKQKRFMDAAAHNPAFAKQAGVPVSVAKDFSEKSKGVKFGGPKTRPDLQKVNEPKTRQGKTELFSKGGDMKESKTMMKKEVGFMKKAGAPKSMIKHEESEMKSMKKMANGGITTAKMGAVRTAAPSRDGIASKGKTKGTMVKMGAAKPLGMKRGGKTC